MPIHVFVYRRFIGDAPQPFVLLHRYQDDAAWL
jgi:hypothetical protein